MSLIIYENIISTLLEHSYFTNLIFFFKDQLSIAEHISPKERLKFCLIGDENTASRRELYIFLLQNMDDVMKFKTKYRICIEILRKFFLFSICCPFAIFHLFISVIITVSIL